MREPARLAVLYEDNHLLVVAKPPGMLVQGDETGDLCLLDLAKAYRKSREHHPGNVFIGLVHRLDRPVSGVVLLARTSKAASRLAEQFRAKKAEKVYLAVAESTAAAVDVGASGVWREPLRKDSSANRVAAAGFNSADAKPAETRWSTLDVRGALHLLRLQPITGRSHQLRVHAAHHGLPLYGDRKYGSKRDFAGCVALHAYSLTILHPTKQAPMRFVCPPPAAWHRFSFDYPTAL